MALFGNKSGKKGDKMGDVIDTEGQVLPENKVVDAFTPSFDTIKVKSKKKPINTPVKKQDTEETTENFITPDDENYRAFSKVREHGQTAINIDIRMRNEQYFLMNCHLIKGCPFYGNTNFEIFYDNDRFKFIGKNLLQLKPYLQHQKILHLQEFDANKHISPIAGEMPLISHIQWIRFDEIIDDAAH